MIDWEKIKNEIVSETKDIFITAKPSIGSVIDLFISVINFDTKEKALEGIKEYYSTALKKLLDDDVDTRLNHLTKNRYM